ncbi:MAG: ABC1 kinase family protein [Phycisphaerae bacterium]
MALSRLRLDRTLAHARRYRHIIGVLMRYGFEEIVSVLKRKLSARAAARTVPSRVKPAARGRSSAERLRLALQEMGPTFVKLGQFLSTRPDLLSEEYIAELEKLQDRVPPAKFGKVRIELESALGDRLENIFADFDETPIAAGSIAQVHQAVTRQGRRIVLKVRRPGIVPTIRTECEILETFAGLLNRETGAETVDLQRMAREFTDALKMEVDLAHERSNLSRFARNFKDDPTIHVPEVIDEFCRDSILAMEYIDGIKPDDAALLAQKGFDTKLIASRGANFVLKQIFEFGLFHADPHPGNFFLLAGDVLAPLDFGQVARLSVRDRGLLVDMVLAIVDQDVARLVDSLARNEMLHDKTAPAALTADLEDLLSEYYDLPLAEIPFRQALSRAFGVIRDHHVHPPSEFTLMLKSVMTIESLAMGLDPQFDILDHLKPYARKFALKQISPSEIFKKTRRTLRQASELAMHLPADMETIIAKFRKGQFQMRIHHEHLEDLERTLDKSSNRISFALIIAALLVGSSMLVGRTGQLLGLVDFQTFGVIGYLLAAIGGGWLLVSIMRSRKV